MKPTTVALLADIASSFSVLAANPAFAGTKQLKVLEYAGLVGLAFQQVNVADEDRVKLLEQIQAANARGTGLTDEERAQWRSMSHDAHNAIQAWDPSNDVDPGAGTRAG